MNSVTIAVFVFVGLYGWTVINRLRGFGRLAERAVLKSRQPKCAFQAPVVAENQSGGIAP